MQKNQIILLGVILVGILATFTYGDFKNWTTDVSKSSGGYLLSVPNLNFEITFPSEPQFHRTDGKDFTRYTWSYIDNSPNGRVGLFVITENNLYAYNSSQEDFIEQTAKIYGGVMPRMEKDPDVPAIDYEIAGVYSDTSPDTETIVGRIVDVGNWTFTVTNQFEKENRYPNFIGSFTEM